MSALGINFLKTNKITKVQDATVAGTSDVTSDAINRATLGSESVTFFTTVGTVTGSAVTSMKVQTSSNNSDWNDVLGTGITIADDDDNQVFGVEIVKPLEQYLRCIIDRATQNCVVETIYAIETGLRKGPADNNVTDTITTELHVSPIEGTA